MTFGKRIDGPGGRRRVARNAAALRAEMRTPTESIDVTFIEMSSIGAKMRGPDMPAAGQSVVVRVGPLEACGTVIWSECDLCGVRFDVPASVDRKELQQRLREQGTLTKLDRAETG